MKENKKKRARIIYDSKPKAERVLVYTQTPNSQTISNQFFNN